MSAATATATPVARPTRRGTSPLGRRLEAAAVALVDEHGPVVDEWPTALFIDARRWRRETAPTFGAGRSLKFVTRDDGSTKLMHNRTATGVGIDHVRQGVSYFAAHYHGSCPWSTPGCRNLCLVTSGQLGLSTGRAAVRARSRLVESDPTRSLVCLLGDLRAMSRYYRSKGADTVVYRFDGTTETALENCPTLVGLFAAVGVDALTDYGKRPTVDPSQGGSPRIDGLALPYYVAPSVSERHDSPDAIRPGHVVVVDRLKDEPLPTTFAGLPVTDGDKHDLRAYDAPGTVVLLRAKGEAAEVVKAARKGGAPITWATFIKPATD